MTITGSCSEVETTGTEIIGLPFEPAQEALLQLSCDAGLGQLEAGARADARGVDDAQVDEKLARRRSR